MDENLVGYLLKSLEPDEQHAVEAHLETHPDARAKLELLERALAPLSADAEEPEPTPGLALTTLARIAEHKCRVHVQAAEWLVEENEVRIMKQRRREQHFLPHALRVRRD